MQGKSLYSSPDPAQAGATCSGLSMHVLIAVPYSYKEFPFHYILLFSWPYSDIDGAYFGTTFPHLFLLTYVHLKPQKPSQHYVPRVFGFKLHKPWLMCSAWLLCSTSIWHGDGKNYCSSRGPWNHTRAHPRRSGRILESSCRLYLCWHTCPTFGCSSKDTQSCCNLIAVLWLSSLDHLKCTTWVLFMALRWNMLIFQS
jgi:hypothetical protein